MLKSLQLFSYIAVTCLNYISFLHAFLLQF